MTASGVDDWELDGPNLIPHCDSRVLHAPGACEYCDKHPLAQAARLWAGVAFTGDAPGPGQQPCPADAARPAGSASDHRRWAGNKPTSARGDSSWPAETFASQVMYGDQGGRGPWPLRERLLRQAAAPLEDAAYWLRGYESRDGFRSFSASSRGRGGRPGSAAARLLLAIARRMH